MRWDGVVREVCCRASRRAVVAGAALACAAGKAGRAGAWCGAEFPPWAYYLTWDELSAPWAAPEAKTAEARVAGFFLLPFLPQLYSTVCREHFSSIFLVLLSTDHFSFSDSCIPPQT